MAPKNAVGLDCFSAALIESDGNNFCTFIPAFASGLHFINSFSTLIVLLL